MSGCWAPALKDLALALFIGLLAGTYSSLFVATPFLCQIRQGPHAGPHQAGAGTSGQRRHAVVPALGPPPVVPEVAQLGNRWAGRRQRCRATAEGTDPPHQRGRSQPKNAPPQQTGNS